MATILLIDDSVPGGRSIKESVESAGHTVEWIQEATWRAALNAGAAKLREEPYDFLILDIQFWGDDDYGGIWLYNELVRQGLLRQWTWVIVYSKYAPDKDKWQDATAGDPLILRVFLDTAGIPLDCALNSQTFARSMLIDKIEDLTRNAPPNSCPTCGQPF